MSVDYDVAFSPDLELEELSSQSLPECPLVVEDYIDDPALAHLSYEQKVEVIKSLWKMMSLIVDMAWGLDSAQQFLTEGFREAGQDSGNVVRLKDSKKEGK